MGRILKSSSPPAAAALLGLLLLDAAAAACLGAGETVCERVMNTISCVVRWVVVARRLVVLRAAGGERSISVLRL